MARQSPRDASSIMHGCPRGWYGCTSPLLGEGHMPKAKGLPWDLGSSRRSPWPPNSCMQGTCGAFESLSSILCAATSFLWGLGQVSKTSFFKKSSGDRRDKLEALTYQSYFKQVSGGIQAGLLGCFLSLPHSPSHFRDSELARNSKQRQKESLTINKGGQWLGR